MGESKTQFDDILIQLGQFGKFQRRQYILLCLPAILCAFHQGASVFLAATPEFRCALPEGVFNGTDTYEIQSPTHEKLVRDYIPMISDNKSESCFIKKNGSLSPNTSSEVQPCTSYVFSKKDFKTSIVTEWGLVCDEKFKATLSTMIYMAGVLVGAFAFGVLSDAIGRKKSLLVSIAVQGVSGLALSFITEYYSFVVLRFLCATASMGLYMTAFVIGMELIGPKYRLIAGVVMNYFFAIGFCILPGIAYAIREWNYTQLAMSVPSFFFLSYFWLVTESSRWLLSKGRVQEAEDIMQKAGKVNNVILPKSVFESFQESTVQQEKISAIFKAPSLLFRTCIIFFNWFAISTNYYGLSLNSGSIGGNIYLNFALTSLVEFPAYTVCFLCDKLGRKPVHVFGMLIGGLACLCTVLVDQLMKGSTDEELNPYFIALNMVGKFGSATAFCIIFFWSAELYPTALRNSLMGMSSVLARVGSIAAPFVSDLGKYVDKDYERVIPGALFGGLAIIGGLLSILLPETSGQKLPETVQDANLFPNRKIQMADSEFTSKTQLVDETEN